MFLLLHRCFWSLPVPFVSSSPSLFLVSSVCFFLSIVVSGLFRFRLFLLLHRCFWSLPVPFVSSSPSLFLVSFPFVSSSPSLFLVSSCSVCFFSIVVCGLFVCFFLSIVVSGLFWFRLFLSSPSLFLVSSSVSSSPSLFLVSSVCFCFVVSDLFPFVSSSPSLFLVSFRLFLLLLRCFWSLPFVSSSPSLFLVSSVCFFFVVSGLFSVCFFLFSVVVSGVFRLRFFILLLRCFWPLPFVFSSPSLFLALFRLFLLLRRCFLVYSGSVCFSIVVSDLFPFVSSSPPLSLLPSLSSSSRSFRSLAGFVSQCLVPSFCPAVAPPRFGCCVRQFGPGPEQTGSCSVCLERSLVAIKDTQWAVIGQVGGGGGGRKRVVV